MGYQTYFSGRVEFVNKKAPTIIRRMIKKDEEPFDCLDSKEFDKGNKLCFSFNCSWKNHDGDMEKMCLFIATLDKEAVGEVMCEGEEAGDLWQIKIKGGMVEVLKGVVNYEYDFDFNDIEIKKKVYEINKDKTLLKEIMLYNLK